ncbi:hydroxyneurosporene synthase [Methylocella silvestris BL2]|uniref:Hydroxyneurosporene synthase n=1 Tax=Methylocella silvestris (strain DSM 15510 / CIP 108128 / LMG 27833 / NCIMB 13906 / BL2) TaxID=395965 RepID=B8EPY3_METSB|nr:carotenoid 1,2-hydratase [Methylocella silvestris]ACK50987.1 hydroxyneurosporene synthase [Methylocella silvestris BL2]
MIGSVFSPYYAWSGRKDPLNHCAFNVALYGERARRWAMTERGREDVRCETSHLSVGPSSMSWNGDALTIVIDEIAAPFPKRLRGVVRVAPRMFGAQSFMLDAGGRHLWRPIAPAARVEVEMEHPLLRWSGEGYFDANWGDAPLEDDFSHWDWSRAKTADGAFVFYDVLHRDGGRLDLALAIDASGRSYPIGALPRVKLKQTLWRMTRWVRSEAQAAVLRTLEDAPFYARSLVSVRLSGEPMLMVHESLSLDRFATNWVKALLPFKMPRAPWDVGPGADQARGS